MKKLIGITLLCLSLAPLAAQDNTNNTSAQSDDEFMDKTYHDVVLENFEETTYSNDNITIRSTSEQEAHLAIRDQFPAPVPNSKKYLGVKVFGKLGDVAIITPPKPIVIEKHCESISMWIYGRNLSGDLSMLIMDTRGDTHAVQVGRLNFTGWKKFTVTIPRFVIQEDRFLSQDSKISIIKILYSPGSTSRLHQWNYFYIDDITARVRDKYFDNQSDNW